MKREINFGMDSELCVSQFIDDENNTKEGLSVNDIFQTFFVSYTLKEILNMPHEMKQMIERLMPLDYIDEDKSYKLVIYSNELFIDDKLVYDVEGAETVSELLLIAARCLEDAYYNDMIVGMDLDDLFINSIVRDTNDVFAVYLNDRYFFDEYEHKEE